MKRTQKKTYNWTVTGVLSLEDGYNWYQIFGDHYGYDNILLKRGTVTKDGKTVDTGQILAKTAGIANDMRIYAKGFQKGVQYALSKF